MSQPIVRVSAEDLESGEGGVQELTAGQYIVIPVEPLYLDGVVQHGNGTVVITLKRRKEQS